MGQLAFGVVGAAVGGYIGGPAGASWGWAIGSAVGGVVFAPDGPQTTGPRLEDLRSNVSTYGQPIPRCYGTIGFMGSLIWMEDIREYESVDQQGKGGDPATATTFTYSASFAVILCRGEVSTIPNSVQVQTLNRIWINEKLWYDVRDANDVNAVVGSANFSRYFKFYPGSQTQMPDPTMEAILGVGNVPAYRGRAYIVFTNFPLDFVQNQPPGALRIMAEVVMAGTPGGGLRFLANVDPVQGAGGTNNLLMPVRDGLLRVLAFGGSPAPPTTVFLITIEGDALGLDVPTDEELEWPYGGQLLDNSVAIMRTFDGHGVRSTTSGFQISDSLTRLYTVIRDDAGDDVEINALDLLPDPTQYIVSVVGSADEQHIFVFTAPTNLNDVDAYHLLQWQNADDGWTLVRTGTVDTANHNMTPATGPSGQGGFSAAMAESDLRHIWWLGTGDLAFSLHYIDDAFEMAETVPSHLFQAGMFAVSVPLQIWVDDGVAYVLVGSDYAVATRNPTGAVNVQTLQDVFEAECALAGLSDAQNDGSFGSLTIVDGMFVRRLGATRGVLQMLEPAYFWDSVESSGVLKGVFRGGASVVTIEDEELGASTRGQAEEDLINPERADEDSLPGEVIVTYIDRASDYQVAAQHDRRSAVATEQPVNLEMPLVFTPDDARQVGSVWMYNQWAGRTRRTFRLSRKYSYLEPTDPFTVRTSIADFFVRALSVKTNDGYLEVDCVDEDTALYTQNAEGANIDQSTGPIQLVTPSRLVLLDIPMLRETDNDGGFYAAVSGYSDTWPGALILRSTDGVTYSTVASVTTSTVIGNVPLALGNYTEVMGYDGINTITVTLLSTATLQSCTDDELLQGANAFALGSTATGYEIVQFKTATLVSGKTWLLKQLLRGRRGTEHEMAGHTTSETFVLLEESKMRRLAVADPAIGVVNYYKAVTFGQLVSSAAAQSFTNTAASLKPYSPVNARATGFGGDITITWTRRGRIYNDWRDGIELPLGEATESYSIDIYSGASVIRTLTSSTPTVTYTTAQQTTDWGSPQPMSLSVRIYQLSAIVGRGFPLIATLS